MIDRDENNNFEEQDVEEGLDEIDAIDARSRIFLEMRAQNVEILKIASQVAGCGGNQGPMKPNDVKQALKAMWEIYAEFYSWVDPEESEDDEDDEDED